MLGSLLASIKASGKRLDSMQELLVEELREIYDAEEQLINALPQLAQSADDPRIKEALRQHANLTMRQRDRLNDVFRRLGEKPAGASSDGMKGIVLEGPVISKAEGDPRVKDAAIIAAAQRAEHYEMAAYGSARSFANYLGWKDVAETLQQTLDEEGQTDHQLTDLAHSGVNRGASET